MSATGKRNSRSSTQATNLGMVVSRPVRGSKGGGAGNTHRKVTETSGAGGTRNTVVGEENDASVSTNKTQVIPEKRGNSKGDDAAGGMTNEPKKKMIRLMVTNKMMGEDKPKMMEDLQGAVEKELQSMVVERIFPYTKFLRSDEEIEDGVYLRLAFEVVGFTGDTHEDAAKRRGHWRAIVEFIKSRLNDKRSAVIAAVKKAAIGM
jgi:hypothetical protein